MSSSGFGPKRDSDNRAFRYAEDQADRKAPLSEPSLLDQVMNQTNAASHSRNLQDDPEVRPFLEVARIHHAESFVLDPVVVDLVKAALRNLRDRESTSLELWNQMSIQVAKTLFEDPVCHERLEAFWARLSAIE